MLPPARLYALVEAWLQAVGAVPHRTARAAVAQLVAALLVAQSLSPADLARALPSPRAVPARQRHKRRARALDRPWLTSAPLTPALVHAALALVPTVGPAQPTTLVLDAVRCGGWDVLVVGVLWRGRVLPVAWAVLPYPWPKGRFTPTVCALVARLARAWPPARPARAWPPARPARAWPPARPARAWPPARPVHLLADRGFASQALFRALAAAGWGFTVRLNARHALTVGGERRTARELVVATPVGHWARHPAATFGYGAAAPAAALVVGRPLRTTPAHQANAGGLRHRAVGAAKRAARVRHKDARPDNGVETDEWVILFTTHPTAAGAQAAYRRRWAIEGSFRDAQGSFRDAQGSFRDAQGSFRDAQGSFRDAQGGWDGRHGWNLEPTAAALATAERVDALCGLWAVGALLQTWLGAATVGPDVPADVAAEAAGWTTTGRLSVWARGRCVLHDRGGRLEAWAARVLADGAARIAAAPPPAARPAVGPAPRAAPPVTPFPAPAPLPLAA